jgi:hypothetical protein
MMNKKLIRLGSLLLVMGVSTFFAFFNNKYGDLTPFQHNLCMMYWGMMVGLLIGPTIEALREK